MKILGFEFKQFSKEVTTVQSVEPIEIHRTEEVPKQVEVVELWIVKWYSLHPRSYSDTWQTGDLNHLAFTSKVVANEYAEQLKKASQLLGDTYRKVLVERQNNPTNI
jgi:hypothetical protein